jgi:phosphatidylinositol kinase/protein kinase (PI-3  family)
MIGHTGVSHSFTVQLPAARHTRREDRVAQLFRMLSTALQTKKESRKRNLAFHLPAAIPLAPSLRLIELDSTYISLQDVFDAHCKSRGLSKEDPILYFADRFRELFDPKVRLLSLSSAVAVALRILTFRSLYRPRLSTRPNGCSSDSNYSTSLRPSSFPKRF